MTVSLDVAWAVAAYGTAPGAGCVCAAMFSVDGARTAMNTVAQSATLMSLDNMFTGGDPFLEEDPVARNNPL